MRPVALGRKNALFAGADSGGRHWAIIATLIQTAKLNDVDPLAWLTDVLQRIVAGRTKRNQLATLLPWNWKAAKLRKPTTPHSACVRSFAKHSICRATGTEHAKVQVDSPFCILPPEDHTPPEPSNVEGVQRLP